MTDFLCGSIGRFTLEHFVAQVCILSLTACASPFKIAESTADSTPNVTTDSTFDQSLDQQNTPSSDATDATFVNHDGLAEEGVDEVAVEVGAFDSLAPETIPDAVIDATAETATDAVIDASIACPADMVSLPTFCIDRYEAPNVAGAKPLAFKTAPEGESWCQGKGKRLCTESEWVRACNGASGRPYPYGATYKKGTCNDDKTWISPSWSTLALYPKQEALDEAARLYQGDNAGSRAGCSSEEGVMDLTGNVAEWVVRSFPHSNNYDHVLKGCYWSGCYGGSPPSCSFTNSAHPGTFRTYEAGFRCCKNR